MSKQKKNQVTADDAVIVVDELVMDAGEFGIHKIAEIRISPDNRKRFNEQALIELAASIKAMGVAQPILMRPVTPTPEQPEIYEIVAGERRYRASTIAGLTEIPAMVRTLTDLQAAKIRILENLQREDPHPLEEAEGYELLMQQHGYNADQLADEIKKSRSYVYGRLKLCALSLDVRPLFLENAISASTALLIARIPVPALQARAAKEVTAPDMYTKEPMSYRRAVQHIQQRYMLDLATAVFPVSDARLLAAAGSCVKCPKRTGNQPEIFTDISADVCTDPDCFGEKRAAHFALVVVNANKKGIPVYEGDEGKAMLPPTWDRSTEHVRHDSHITSFLRNAPSTGNSGRIAEHLGERMPTPAYFVKTPSGEVSAIYKREAVQQALEAVGACETADAHSARLGTQSSDTDEDDEDDDAAPTGDTLGERAAAETNYRVTLYKRLRQKIGEAGFGLESLRALAKHVVGQSPLPSDVLDYTFDTVSDAAICAHIDQAEMQEVHLILVDLLLGESLGVNRWNVATCNDDDCEDGFASIKAMARNEGIDPDAVREELFPTPIDLTSIRVGARQAADDIASLIQRSPARINDLCAKILSDAPNLVTAFESAAKRAGYVYGIDRQWIKSDEQDQSNQTTESAKVEASPAVEEVESDPGLNMDEIPVVAKSSKKAKAKVPAKRILSPAAAWPFPRSYETPAQDTDAATPQAAVPAEPVAPVA